MLKGKTNKQTNQNKTNKTTQKRQKKKLLQQTNIYVDKKYLS